MKSGSIILAASILLIAAGCGQQKESHGGKPPEGVAEAERADSTALDSAIPEETPPDTMATQHDSM